MVLDQTRVINTGNSALPLFVFSEAKTYNFQWGQEYIVLIDGVLDEDLIETLVECMVRLR